jgi:hypothetical protein
MLTLFFGMPACALTFSITIVIIIIAIILVIIAVTDVITNIPCGPKTFRKFHSFGVMRFFSVTSVLVAPPFFVSSA